MSRNGEVIRTNVPDIVLVLKWLVSLPHDKREEVQSYISRHREIWDDTDITAIKKQERLFSDLSDNQKTILQELLGEL